MGGLFRMLHCLHEAHVWFILWLAQVSFRLKCSKAEGHPMSLDTLHQKQRRPTDHGQLQQTAVVLICKSSLVRAGIRHILDGTPFIVAADLEDSSELPAVPDASPALYILDESHAADALAEIVSDLKAQCPSARVVVLADNLDPETTVRAFQVGINGLCSTRMGH